MGSSPPVFRLGYLPALDGLRAVSILAVLARHSGWLGGGYLGVDVFFALSGFLITALLTEEYGRTGTIALRLFYARRALRLLPALAVLIVICVVVELATLPPEYGPLVLQQAAAVIFYAGNWAAIWGLPMGLFIHAWSLAIEEQFYLVWPLILIVLLRGIRHRLALTAVVLAGAGAACLWRVVLTQPGVTFLRLYVAPDAHADSLLVGCAASLLLSSGGLPTGLARNAVRAGGVVGAVALAILFFASTFPGDYVRHQVSLLTALAAGLVIIDMCVPGSLLARGLERWPLVGLGRISYGVYLWHVPIFTFVGALSIGDGARPLTTVIAAWVATFTVALTSYVVVERPALALKRQYAAGASIERRTPAGHAARSVATASSGPSRTPPDAPRPT